MLYTIGTSNRSLAEFVSPIRQLGVKAAFDVRSRPYSRFHHFNREQIRSSLEQIGIAYHWRGDTLGGDLTNVLNNPASCAALDELMRASGEAPAVMFCAEGHPHQCHRSTTIGRSLIARSNLVAINILRNDQLEPMDVTLARP